MFKVPPGPLSKRSQLGQDYENGNVWPRDSRAAKHTDNVVLGLYDGYTSLDTVKGGLRLFVESFRHYNKEDMIVIFVQSKNMFPELKAFAERFGVELVDYNEESMLKWNEDRQTYRLLLYKQWLDNGEEAFGKILLSDTNDVMFFGNPFDIETESIYCALEKTRYRNSGENMSSVLCNVGWLHRLDWTVSMPNLTDTCLNKSKVESIIHGKNVVCSGTILGKSEAIAEYLSKTTQGRYVTYTGLDQGCFNKYVYSHPPNVLDMVRFEHSRILTLDSIDHSAIQKDEEGFYINELGERYLVVHQIDRGCQIEHFKKLHAKHHK